jgi:uncharacterized repeat protein (TIGR02543 family)
MRPSLRLSSSAIFILFVLQAICLGAGKTVRSGHDPASGPRSTLSPQANYGDLPLAFEPNTGQFDPQVRFLTHSRNMAVFFTDDEAVMVLHSVKRIDRRGRSASTRPSKPETQVVRMKLVGASKPSQAQGLDKLPGYNNYFIGNDPAKWRTNIPNYGRIEYKGLYPGVDLVAYGTDHQLEYDLVVAPGADPRQIELAWEGADHVDLNAAGDLVLSTRLGDLVEKRPRVYQRILGREVEIDAKYAVTDAGRVQFALARYDTTQPLVIDPAVTISYATYLGSTEEGDAIAVDSTGAAYITGITYDSKFPTKSFYQKTNNDANCSGATTFVTKFVPAGTSLAYSTYLGGNCEDDPNGIAVDSSGAAYIAGTAGSLNFPLSNYIQNTCPNLIPGAQYGGVFVTKLAPTGDSLPYSTYICGGYSDHAGGIAVDSSGSAYITGDTSSDFWPVQSAYQGTRIGNTNAFITKLSPSGTSFVYSTLLGRNEDYGRGIAVDSSGSAYVTGETNATNLPTVNAFQPTTPILSGFTGFVAKLSPLGNSLGYYSYLGGSGGEQGNAIAVDAGDAAFVTGVTYSTDFPLRNAIQTTNKNPDAGTCFVTKVGTAGTSLIYSTYLGGSATGGTSGDDCYAIATDSAKEAWVVGNTYSMDFPLQYQYMSRSLATSEVAFITKFTASGTIDYSTFIGGDLSGAGYGVAVDSTGAAYVTGRTYASNASIFPGAGAYQTKTSTSGGPFVEKVFLPGEIATVVGTSPSGLTFTVDGQTYNSVQTFGWTPNTTHTIMVSTTPQAGATGTRYSFASWSDGGLPSHTVTASATGGTFTAAFTTQYLLTVAASPSAGGPVTENPPSADMYYNSGTPVQLTAGHNPGYTFANWTGDLTGATNPQTLNMTMPRSVTANFSAQGPSVALLTASGSGAVQTFSATYSSSGGYKDLQWVQILFATATNGGGTTFCFVHYDAQGQGLWLYGDGGFFVGPVTPGTPSNKLQNSLCAVNTSASSASGTGNTLTLNANLVFKAAAARNIYMRAYTLEGVDTGWVQVGTWGAMAAALGTLKVSLSSGSSSQGAQQIFQLTYPDPQGFAGAAFGWVQFLIAAATNGGGQPFCFVHYDRAGNGLWMYSGDVGYFLGPVAPGTASNALSSSACSVNPAATTVTNTGGNLVVSIAVTPKAPMVGAKNLYQRTLDVLNRDTGWQQTGTWTIH